MKKRKIIHSALSLSLTAALCLSMAACGGTQTPADSVAASQPSAPSAVSGPVCILREIVSLHRISDTITRTLKFQAPQASGLIRAI